ncbi:histidinol-phosphatase [Thiohalophilus thiocyanatoxydans]|uniref:Histidinol-phosphatase n=1 Tax=Thiohalophilus thiocyanatoxydans TaxID=381308 RepID=A0A4R8IK50_9GAMM|nr:HAD family hydrolase [Thiohalophilus thiocyanatoxydans]TDX99369.1 HAD superfamily hydrolase (TIGR01490 family) [Thiohalophilus thiocyanatoxydans]
MALAIFDLDNTLLDGDSDYLWGRFLVAQGRVDGDSYERENHRFYEEYRRGQLDIQEFLAFSLKPLSEIPPPELAELHRRFMEQAIRPRITAPARELLARHRAEGDFLLIITATNRFITAPIAEELGVDDLLATDPEQIAGRYTGRVSGIPCFREGKVERLEQWLKQTGQNLADSWFYSDSRNDLPLLERVTRPVAVDPDETLADHAAARGWPIISLRESSGS